MQRRQPHHIVVAFVVDLRDVRDRERHHDIKHGNLMRRLLATMSNCTPALAPALLALFMLPLPSDVARSNSSAPEAEAAATPSAPPLRANDTVVYQPNPSTGSEPGCATPARTAAEIADARAYLIETASPGFTMTLQGAELAIGRLHPEFVVRLANAIREARSAGMPFAGVFSAYRPPAFGVGGFSDKFNSLHTYGLAVDMHGIGRPGSPEAQLWHETAARNGVVCPYGPRDRAEWNHCQPTSVKIIVAENPLRETVKAEGPSDLESMFEAGNTIIADMASAANSVSKAVPASVRALEAVAHGREVHPADHGKPPNRIKTVARHWTPSLGAPGLGATRRGAQQLGTCRRQIRAAREAVRRHRRRRADHRGRGRATERILPAGEARHPHRHRTDQDHGGREGGADVVFRQEGEARHARGIGGEADHRRGEPAQVEVRARMGGEKRLRTWTGSMEGSGRSSA